jgi:sec-independent protein translocase protein TatB
MFGVSFSELALIFVVAMVVLGPKRLPGLVRKIGRWVGKARSMARDFQQQLENEINLDELNRMTETTAKQAQEATPSPPPEAFSDPPAPPASMDSGTDSLAASGYPYGPQDPTPAPTPETAASQAPPETAPAAAPQPGDDTYSHAHAPGEAPMADVPPDAGTTSHKQDQGEA